ncbi:MAG: hypothetical protein H0T73_17800, partial [Ardenticatenales bacterium]|nr:hypothetical protein [Ardenticatenales bacterium]
RWPHQGNPIDYRRLAQTLLEEREKKQVREEEVSATDKVTLFAIAISILVLIGALGFVLGAWLL